MATGTNPQQPEVSFSMRELKSTYIASKMQALISKALNYAGVAVCLFAEDLQITSQGLQGKDRLLDRLTL